MKITYERKKSIAQSRGKRELYERYVRRERDREKDFINKPSAGLRRILPNPIHVFEDLDKEDLVSRKRGKNRRRGAIEHHGKEYIRRISEVTLTAHVDPSNTSRECPRCGLKMSRHRVASINIRRRYLEGKRREKRKNQYAGFLHSNEPEISMKVELWVGVTQSG
jgi:putative transposase